MGARDRDPGMAAAVEAVRVLDLMGRAIPGACAELGVVGAGDFGREAPGLSESQQGERTAVGKGSAVFAGRVCETASADLRAHLGVLALDADKRRLASLRASVGIAGRFAEFEAARPGFRPDAAWFVTLTYRGVSDWQASHVRDALRRFRQWCRRRGFAPRYVWVAELQQRGALHYHVCVWLPHGVRMPKWDLRLAGQSVPFWPHGMTQREPVRKSAVGYLMKYLSKGSGFAGFPKGARAMGTGGECEDCKAMRRWVKWPEFIRARCGVGASWAREPGGGWRDPDGRVWCSEWRVVLVSGKRCLERVADHGRPFAVDGAYCAVPRAIVGVAV